LGHSGDVIYLSLLCFWCPESHFDVAVDYYTQAIALNPHVAVYYGNRSFAYVKTESYGYALADANKALELDNRYIKVSSL
jgi:serine/threonine-protein phosphatase 5